jgi:MFS family permease
VGVLWFSCLLAGVGLFLLSIAESPVIGLLSATVWGIGVCYMWPTMLATVSERYPRGGALALGLMGTGGTLSIYFVLPVMGGIYDRTKIAAAGGAEAFKALGGEKLNEALTLASQTSFRYVAVLPVVLLFVFGAAWLYDRARGGYKPQKLMDVSGEGMEEKKQSENVETEKKEELVEV